MNASEAATQIARILRKLEGDSGSLVAGIELVDVDVTQATDAAPQINRSVRITLRPVPGTNWCDLE